MKNTNQRDQADTETEKIKSDDQESEASIDKLWYLYLKSLLDRTLLSWE